MLRRAFAVALLALALAMPAVARAQAPLSDRLLALTEAEPGRLHTAWVFLRDKGPNPAERLTQARTGLTPRALSRRRLRGVRGGDVELADLPVPADYMVALAMRVTRVRQVSRWLNAVSVQATAAELEEVAALPFVTGLDRVARLRRGPVAPADAPRTTARPAAPPQRADHLIDYGPSLAQLEQIGVPALHDVGLHGQDVVIAVLDAGFDNLTHEAFSALDIVATWDFVNGDPDVGNADDQGEGSHGTGVLSAIGGYAPGRLVGPAFAASYVLAKTENTESELPIEEDNWTAAAEWAESLGAEVITTSLGYLQFDTGSGYTAADMDGATAVSSRAAQRAAELGVVVLASAGNGGLAPTNTLSAPADAPLVLAVGAVADTGLRASFSSVGPTADGRLKPDVMARGVAVTLASSLSPSLYRTGNGTSFACPLAAGVAALVLQAHPDYSVAQVIEALRSTSSRAFMPDNLYGWGILNAPAAVLVEVPRR